MSAKKKFENPRRLYVVQSPYQCPNRKCWHKEGAEVELLPCEAEFLVLGGKVQLKAELAARGKEKANA